MYVNVLLACLVPVEASPEMVVDSPKTGDCELPCGCWKPIPGPLEEQPVLLEPHAISPAHSEAGFF